MRLLMYAYAAQIAKRKADELEDFKGPGGMCVACVESLGGLRRVANGGWGKGLWGVEIYHAHVSAITG